ncbi:MAG: hypothetical protein ABSF14_13655 [Terriglobia bacterium]|jgi:hypothetical protein
MRANRNDEPQSIALLRKTLRYWATIQEAAANNRVDPAILGAIAIREQVAQSLCLSDSAVLNMINIHCIINARLWHLTW